jgi:hypothetical protein
LGSFWKKALDGLSSMIANLPIARASAVVVQSTSERDGFTKI